MNRLTSRSLPLTGLLFGAFVLTMNSVCAARETSGFTAPELFNQANAFARDGKNGQAILTYERARLLAPNDADIAANEHVVRVRSGLPDAIANRVEQFFTAASPNAFSWLGCIGIVLAGFSLLLMRLLPGSRGLFRTATTMGIVFILLAVGNAAFAWPKMNEAVVIAHNSPARVSPVTVAETTFKLREGEIVTVNAEAPDFALVKDSAGRFGWVTRADIESIVPRSRN